MHKRVILGGALDQTSFEYSGLFAYREIHVNSTKYVITLHPLAETLAFVKDLKITVIGSGEGLADRVADISARLDDYDQAYRCVTGIGYAWFDMPCVPEDTIDTISWSVRTEPENGIKVYFKTYDVTFRG